MNHLRGGRGEQTVRLNPHLSSSAGPQVCPVFGVWRALLYSLVFCRTIEPQKVFKPRLAEPIQSMKS